MIPELKRLVPGARISFLAGKSIGNLLNGYEGIDNLFIYEDHAHNLKDLFKSNSFSSIVHVFPRFDIAFAAYRAGIPVRVGTAYRWYSFLFNRKIKEHRKHSIKHEADYNLNLLGYLNKEISYNKIFKFRYSAEEENALRNKLKGALAIDDKFIILHSGSKQSSRDLPLSKMLELAGYIISKYPQYRIAVTGTETERGNSHRFVQSYGDKVAYVTGMLKLKEMLILADKSSLLIANSTGPIHIAGALNKKILGFYPNSAPMTPVRWRPLSDNAVILTPESGDDMTAITDEQIHDAIDKLLN